MDSVAAATRFLCDGYIGKYVPHVVRQTGRQAKVSQDAISSLPLTVQDGMCHETTSIQAGGNKQAECLACTVRGSLPSLQLPPVHHRRRWGVWD